MIDIIIEVTRASIVSLIFLYIVSVGKKQTLYKQNGWSYIILGFALILFGMLIDITDNFTSLNRYIVIGDTEFQAFLEKVIGYLLGFLFLSIGFWKWLPTIIALEQARTKLKSRGVLLKKLVKKRTQRLEKEIEKRKRVQEELKRVNSELGLAVEQRTRQLKQTNQILIKEINERKQVEKSLKWALKNTKTMLESMPFGVIVVGKDKKIRMANKATLKLMGVESEEEILNQVCHKKICPAEIDKCPVLDLGQPVDSSEKILICKDGEHIPILKTVLPINYEGEAVLLEAFIDISKMKQVEEALKSAKYKAEAANSAKSDFLSNMSHELRTPLNHIIGFTGLVLDKTVGELNELQIEYLTDVSESSNHLLSLINDILDLSKVEAGRLELILSYLDPRILLENSLIMIREKAMKHGIGISTTINGIPDKITADERKLKQIMYNLLSNAVKFTPDGGKISITAQHYSFGSAQTPIAASNQNRGVKISVSDTGIGLKPEDLDRIFKPFEQVENTASRRFQGTGLGLSLTKKLVELHGGKIWVDSEGEGKGSNFMFTLPFNLVGPEDASLAQKISLQTTT